MPLGVLRTVCELGRQGHDSGGRAGSLLEGEGKSIPFMKAGEMQERVKGVSFYILTNSMKLYGPGCIQYQGMLEQDAERIGSGFYVLPGSVHEVIIVPSDKCRLETARELKNIVKSINGTQLPEYDMISDSVYYYNREEHSFAVTA